MSSAIGFDLAPLVFGDLSRQRTEESVRSTGGTPIVRVKNTFIEAWSSDGDSTEDEELPVVATRSCPTMKMPSDGPSLRAPSTPKSACAIAWEEARERAPAVVASQQAMPLEFRQPEASVGAALHGVRECKPCAWFWRPQGCDNGVDCRHCHLCPAGELKARKISKRSSRRKPVTDVAERTPQDFAFFTMPANWAAL
mmetsp:Transcript_49870/g.143546  ORF Transcript_49870/g.143546 Transcript_49870/m.143546 type:complete len:197 (-) Transcript_49870:192-782(-)